MLEAFKDVETEESPNEGELRVSARPSSPLAASLRVLVALATDNTEDAVLSFAHTLAHHRAAQVTVLRAWDPAQFGVPKAARTVMGFADAVLGPDFRTRRQSELAAHIAARFGAPQHWIVDVEFGDAASAIRQGALRHDSTLILMGLHRHGPLSRTLGADTINEVMAHTGTPILALHPSLKTLPRHAIVGVDFSDASAVVAHLATRLLSEHATLELVHVRPTLSLEKTEETQGVFRIIEKGIEGAFDEFIEKLQAMGLPSFLKIIPRTIEGNPAHALIEYANNTHPDLLALGAHSHTPISRLVLGSTTRTLLDVARWSVLLTPPPPAPSAPHSLPKTRQTPQPQVIDVPGAPNPLPLLSNQPQNQLRLLVALKNDTTDSAPLSVARLILAKGAQAAIVTVVELGGSTEVGGTSALHSIVIDPEFQAIHKSSIRRELAAANIHAECPIVIGLGDATSGIIEASHTLHPDIIVTGMRPHSRIAQALGNATTHELMRYGTTPVLAVPINMKPVPSYPTKILVAMDFSAASMRAANLALRLMTKGTLHLVHVRFSLLEREEERYEGLDVVTHAGADSAMRSVIRELESPNIHIQSTILEGDVTQSLLDFASMHSPDLIAIGSQRHPRLERLILGSVAKRFVTEARWPVLVTPPRPLPDVPPSALPPNAESAPESE